MNQRQLACVILAAGNGTRMKSNYPKVLTPFYEKPILEHIIEKAEKVNPAQIVVVVSPQYETLVREQFSTRITVAVQTKPLGTGDALLSGLDEIESSIHDILVLCGDTPLIQSSTLRQFVTEFYTQNSDAGIITAQIENPKKYGRIIRTSSNAFERIVEWKDASNEEKAICEINSGMYLFSLSSIQSHLDSIQNNDNASGEFYITNLFSSLIQNHKKITLLQIQGEEEIIGINTKKDLAQALQLANQEHLDYLMVEKGVIILDPNSTYIGPNVTIDKDTVIKANTWLEGTIQVGEDCTIGPFVCMRGTKGPIVIKDHCSIGPFTSLREGCILEPNAKAGTFVEMKKTQLHPHSKANHLSYLGDAEIGESSNIGAGTITCNYDGFGKNKTTIGKNVFIGSDTIIVAPVSIEDGAYTGAGSVITQNVPKDALALERNKQVNKEGWAKRYKAQKEKRGSK